MVRFSGEKSCGGRIDRYMRDFSDFIDDME